MIVINEVKSFMSKSFDMKDLGEADVILNIKLIKNENGITLTQSHYVEKVLSRFGFNDGKTSPTPYDLNLITAKEISGLVALAKYMREPTTCEYFS